MFYREEFRIARVEGLTIMYAMTKKEKISPVKLMAHYWLTILGLKRGAVTSTSWVTRITNGLGLLDCAVIAYINTPRRIIDYSFFSQAHILRKRNRKIIMRYKGYTKEKMLLRWSPPSLATLISTVRDHHMHTVSLQRTKFHLVLILLQVPNGGQVTTGGLVIMLIIIRRNMEKL
jgi:hypothetical protein